MSGPREEIREPIGPGTEIADAERRGEGSQMEQDATSSFFHEWATGDSKYDITQVSILPEVKDGGERWGQRHCVCEGSPVSFHTVQDIGSGATCESSEFDSEITMDPCC